MQAADNFMAFSGQLAADVSVVARSRGHTSEIDTCPTDKCHPQQSRKLTRKEFIWAPPVPKIVADQVPQKRTLTTGSYGSVAVARREASPLLRDLVPVDDSGVRIPGVCGRGPSVPWRKCPGGFFALRRHAAGEGGGCRLLCTFMAKSIIMLFAIKALPEVNGRALHEALVALALDKRSSLRLRRVARCWHLYCLGRGKFRLGRGSFGIHFGCFSPGSLGRAARLRGPGWRFYQVSPVARTIFWQSLHGVAMGLSVEWVGDYTR